MTPECTTEGYPIQRLKHPAGPETVLVKIEFYKKMVFCLSEATIVVTWKVGNLDVQIWVFFGQMVFSPTVKRDFLVYFDWTSAGIFFTLSFAASVEFLKQLLVLVTESPLPHLGIQHDIFVPGTQRVGDELFAAGAGSINPACMAFDGDVATKPEISAA